MAVRDNILAGYQLIWNTAQKNVELMPENGMEFTPAGLDTRSFRAIAMHMANSSVFFGDSVGKANWERSVTYPDKPTSKADVLKAMNEAGQRFSAGVSRLNDEDAGKMVGVPWGGQMPQAAVLMGGVSHMFYHNGQLSIYLRMQGVKPFFIAR
jgi:uncharacterized damage-inducible protein DinB